MLYSNLHVGGLTYTELIALNMKNEYFIFHDQVLWEAYYVRDLR